MCRKLLPQLLSVEKKWRIWGVMVGPTSNQGEVGVDKSQSNVPAKALNWNTDYCHSSIATNFVIVFAILNHILFLIFILKLVFLSTLGNLLWFGNVPAMPVQGSISQKLHLRPYVLLITFVGNQLCQAITRTGGVGLLRNKKPSETDIAPKAI